MHAGGATPWQKAVPVTSRPGRAIRRWLARRSPNLVPLVCILFAVLAANLPVLLHVVTTNPLVINAYLTPPTSGRLPGLPYIDPNAGYTTQALGHLAALDWLHEHVPWWDPFEGIGAPLAGEMQSGAFFPLTILLALHQGLLLLQLMLEAATGWSTYFLIRRLGVGKPGVRPAEAERHPGCRGERTAHAQSPDEEVGGPSGGCFEHQLEQEQALVEGEQNGQREERTALHLTGQRRPDPLEGVPPRDVLVEPVEGGQVAEGLGGVPGVGVDVGKAGQPARGGRRQVGVDDERVGGDDVQQHGEVGRQDGEEDAHQGDEVGRPAGEPPPNCPTGSARHWHRFLPRGGTAGLPAGCLGEYTSKDPHHPDRRRASSCSGRTIRSVTLPGGARPAPPGPPVAEPLHGWTGPLRQLCWLGPLWSRAATESPVPGWHVPAAIDLPFDDEVSGLHGRQGEGRMGRPPGPGRLKGDAGGGQVEDGAGVGSGRTGGMVMSASLRAPAVRFLELPGWRIRLATLVEGDYEAWLAVRTRCRSWLIPWEPRSKGAPPAPEDAASFVARCGMRERERQLGSGFGFGIFVDGRFAGEITLSSIQRGPFQNGAIGYWIDEELAGSGLIPEAVVVVLQFAFETLRLHRIEVAIIPRK